MRRLRTIVLSMLLGALSGGLAHGQPDARVLARVGSEAITVEDFERSYVAALIATGRDDTPTHRAAHLDDLLAIYQLAREARRRGLDRDADFLAFEERTRRQALAGRFYDTALVETLVPLTDAEIREAFARSKTQVVLRHLFYRDEAAARAAHARLRDGRDFLAEAADCYGLAAIDSSAGYLGPVQYFQVDDAVAEAAFALDVGAFSAPVRSRFGYHILRVEEKIHSPLLTEAEYQTRKGGVAAQLRQRRRRLHGDRFVRAFMDSLRVQISPAGIRALARALENLEARETVAPVALAAPTETPLDVEALRNAFRPETPLATYVFEGQERRFTAGDYFFWLDDLPPAEARQRPAASVGRALRNEVFAEAARQQGLGDDAYVEQEVGRQARVYLAQRLQTLLFDSKATPGEDGWGPAAPLEIDPLVFEEIIGMAR